jgi:3-phosphoglycerate kinase
VLELPVQFASNCVGEEAKSAANLKAGEVLLLEIYVFMQKKRMVMLL